jgi:preprotein translocase subunit YajC
LNVFATILAQPTQPTTGKVDPGPWGFLQGPIMPVILIMMVFYFFMMKNKRGDEQKRKSMLAELKKGDEIQTIGGIIGKVVEVRDDRVQVKVDETANSKIWFSRNAIHRVVEEDKAEAK